MSEYTIEHRWTGAVLYTGGGGSLRDVVVAAVKSGADLSGADLSGAYLSGSKLVGNRPVLQIGPIGSRADYLVAYLTDAGVMVRAGCFCGSLDEFRAACAETHGDGIHGREYAAAIQMIATHAALWTPAAEQPQEAAA